MAADRPGDFGTKLRDARERKGVSLRQIANQTKISVAALEALERNDISRLPGGIFSRAFVRSYAIEVGLDPETTIQEFIAQFPHDSVTAGHPTSEQIEDYEALESDRRMASTVLWILAISIPLAGAVVYFSMASRHAAIAPPAAPASAPATTEIKSEPTADSAAAPVVPATTDAAPTAATVPAVPSTTSRTNAPPPIAPAAAAAAPAGAEAPADRLTIELSARRPVWVSATVDGQRTISRLLQVGEKQTAEIKHEMVITAGDASALSLTLNGAEGRALGKAGEVVTARITLNNFKDYLAR